jgi:Fe-S-cluster containining protein
MSKAAGDRIAAGLKALGRVKERFVRRSDRAARTVRSCSTCDAHCCKVGFNSMKVHRIEAEALRRRLLEPDLAPLRPEILAKARREIEERGLTDDPDASYTCPLLSDDGQCLVHGPAQPAGCLSFSPVSDGGCDHDFEFFERQEEEIYAAGKLAYGKEQRPVSIPVALTRVLKS